MRYNIEFQYDEMSIEFDASEIGIDVDMEEGIPKNGYQAWIAGDFHTIQVSDCSIDRTLIPSGTQGKLSLTMFDEKIVYDAKVLPYNTPDTIVFRGVREDLVEVAA